MPLELEPPQPDPVARAIETLLGTTARPPVDPWWAVGIAESLGGDDGASAQDAWGGAGVIEP